MNRTGQTIDARYRVERRIGTGGMADVFACEDLQLGRHVALKVLHEQLAEDPQVVARFRRESQSAAGLQHPHIVQVFDRGDWDGIPYMAMELVDGVTLKDVIRDQAPLDPVKTIDQISQVLDALRYAHRRGLVHRDIKPQNVLVGPDGDLKVADFGIARAVDDLQMTQTGMIVGTAHYLSPEQASGQPITPAADLYAVGVVLFEMLTGRLPFDGDQPVAIALKHVNEEPPALSIVNPEVPADLEAVVMRALNKAPDERFTDAEEFIGALQQVRHRIVSGAPEPERGTFTTGARGYGVDQPTGGWLQPAAGMAVPAGVAPEEAREQAEARQRRRRAWTITVALATLVALALIGYLIFGRMETVPNVIGISQAKAEQRLEERGFKVKTESVLDEAPKGQVFRQDPRAPRRVRHGSTVLISVSAGRKQITVPVVDGLSAAAARQKLRDAGFADANILQREQASTAIPADQAIETQPEAGVQVDPTSQIQLIVSSGVPTAKDQVEVPDVVGRTRAEAEAAIKAQGLTADVTESESTTATPGDVTAQNPPAKTMVAKGSAVRLTVAKKPADEPNPPANTDVTVPDVEKQTRADADKALKDAGLRPRYTTVSVTDEALDGKVVNQFPRNRKVPKNSIIDLQIGKFQPTTTTNPSDNGAGASTTDPGGGRSPVATGASVRTAPVALRALPAGSRAAGAGPSELGGWILRVIAWSAAGDDRTRRA